MRDRPDQDSPLRDAADIILQSKLGRKALLFHDYKEFPLFLNDLMREIHKLTLSCHLPEFTNHGLDHLCSLVSRISEWSGTKTDAREFICDKFDADDAAALLIAVLIHDIGMLSQRLEDLEQPLTDPRYSGDIGSPNWIRLTHIPRMKKLVMRLFQDNQDYDTLLRSPFMNSVFCIAKAHGYWPHDPEFADLPCRDQGLAAVLAISDLLDEDSSRCDTETLFQHRNYTQLNLVHWIRHALTLGKAWVKSSKAVIRLGCIPGTDSSMEPVYCALRNHYRLSQLYGDALECIEVERILPEFCPDGFPTEQIDQLSDWTAIPLIPDQYSLMSTLLLSFMPEAKLDAMSVSNDFIDKAITLGFEKVDLSCLYSTMHSGVISSDIEKEFNKLVR